MRPRLSTIPRLALAAWLLAACGPQAPRARNALLVTLDTTRADVLGCYGGPIETPTLDGLAREGLLFSAARTVAPLTLPAHASMLTGLYPPRHGLRNNGWSPLSPEADTLAERARARGWQTAAFVAAAALDASLGLDQGFEVYDQPLRPSHQESAHFAQRPAGEVLDAAARWFEQRDRSRPFLAWVHFFDPHTPYSSPPEFASVAGGNPYLAEVAYMDAVLGELLAPLRADGTLDETLLVVVGDHGEGLGDHGEATHGSLCYESVLRVPLLVRLPGGERAGERSRATASVVDVFSTLTTALDLGPARDVDGRDLLELDPDDPRGIYFESYAGYLDFGWSPLAGWLQEDTKYLHSSAPELYSLALDPDETQDQFAPDADAVARARQAMEALARRPRLPARELEGSDPELLAALAALGYAASGPPDAALPDPLEPTDRPAPRERLGEHRLLQQANLLVDQGRLPEAIEVLRGVVAENPRHLLALDLLGAALQRTGELEEARQVLRARLERGPERVETWRNLGIVLGGLGDLDGAEQALLRALELDPDPRGIQTMLDQLREMRGR